MAFRFLAGITAAQPFVVSTISEAGRRWPNIAGEAPQEIAGLMQLNVVGPSNVAPGAAVPMTIQVGTAASPSGVTIVMAQPATAPYP